MFIRRAKRRASIVLRCILMAATLPLLTTLVVTIVMQARLSTHDRRGLAETVRMASVWLADALSRTEESEREALTRDLSDKLQAQVGLFDRRGVALVPTPLAKLPREELHRVINTPVTETSIEGAHQIVASAPVYTPNGRLTLVLASDQLLAEQVPHLGGTGGLIALAAVLFAAVLGFGYLHGRDVAAVFARLKRRLAAVMQPRDTVATEDLCLSAVRELKSLYRSIATLEQRFSGELAIYRDALDEVKVVDQQRTVFLSTVAKELRAPLQAIDRQAEEIVDGRHGELTEAQLDDVRIIRQASGRLLRLVDDILDFSVLLGGQFSFDPRPVDLVEIAREVAQTARGELEDKPLQILVNVPEQPILVNGDRQRLWQVLTNLVSNGIKFTEQGEVQIEIRPTGPSKVIVEVSDSGIGIPQSAHESIFDPFQQRGEMSTRRRGAGLGLAISKRLVELHRGTIRISAATERGSQFIVTLPVAQ